MAGRKVASTAAYLAVQLVAEMVELWAVESAGESAGELAVCWVEPLAVVKAD